MSARGGADGAGRHRPPGQLSRLGTLPAIALCLVFTGGPLLVIIAFSFMTQPETGGGVIYQFTLEAYRSLFVSTDFSGVTAFDPTYLRVIWDSFVQASLTTVICLALGFPLALWITTRSNPRTQTVLVFLVTIPFWTNELVRTYAWVLLLQDNGLIARAADFLGIPVGQMIYTDGATLIGLIYTFFPFMVLPIYSGLAGFDFRYVEAAYDLGASKEMVVRRIILPMARGGIIAGVILVFMPALGAYLQPVMLGGGRVLLIGNLIATQFGDGRNWPLGAALSVLVLAVLLLVLLALAQWSRRTGTKVDLSI